ncbi:MAG: hypothetical protein HKO65_19825 [Gemmatimonadetes bacterium]|nr:hypothetical protein [Gemmatimonadota bacterium]NNM07353.1 hypothetical protein [Gemmatimonadota bacterium]
MAVQHTRFGRPFRGTLLGALLFLGMATPVSSQGLADVRNRRPVEGFGAFRAGLMNLHLDELNARLGKAGFPKLDAAVPVWGGGGYGSLGDFLLGGEVHAGLDPAVSSGARRVSLKGGYGLARVRYVAPSFAGLTLYPTAGAGAGVLRLQIAELGASDFDGVLDDSGRSSTLSGGIHPLLDFGLGLEYRMGMTTGPEGQGGGILLGVEAGYMVAPGDTSWRVDGLSDVDDGPELKIEGFYLWFSLGGWGHGASTVRPDSGLNCPGHI